MPALGGMYADEMAKCLVKSTDPADRSVLVRWLFAAGASHPDVVATVSISGSQREDLNRAIAAFEAAFQVLGQVAGRELFSHPAVAGSMAEVDKYLDKKKLEGLVDAPKK